MGPNRDDDAQCPPRMNSDKLPQTKTNEARNGPNPEAAGPNQEVFLVVVTKHRRICLCEHRRHHWINTKLKSPRRLSKTGDYGILYVQAPLNAHPGVHTSCLSLSQCGSLPERPFRI